MFFRILKKDLLRKRTMNIILLLFIILGTMFISSSVKNLVTVTTTLEDYFKMAGLKDYFVGTLSNGKDYADVVTVMDQLENIEGYQYENLFIVPKKENFHINDETIDMPMAMLFASIDQRCYRYFDSDNQELTSVNEGEIYVPNNMFRKENLKVGDTISVKIEGLEKEFRLAGNYKDALLGTDFTSTRKLILNQKDFDYFYKNPKIIPYSTTLANVETKDRKALEKEFSKLDASYMVNFNIPISMIKNTYIMDILVTITLMVFSVFIILIAMTILNFIIRFSIDEEIREIGVMKAIGIPQHKTRFLYVIKYLGLSFFGAIFGGLCSIPFGRMLLKKSAQNIVMQSNENYYLNFLSSIGVVIVIVLFSYHCTRKMKKYTPMDAIRNGETGERYARKGSIRFNHTFMTNSLFLAVNDLLSEWKRYLVLLLTFILSLLLITVLSNTASTLQSEKLVLMLGDQEADVYLSGEVLDLEKLKSKEGKEYLKKRLRDIEKELEKEGISCKASSENWLRIKIEHGGNRLLTDALVGIEADLENYAYAEGMAPKAPDEIALTPYIAERLDVEIGDVILCNDKECMVTAIFDCFNNMGNTIRIHPDLEKSFENWIGTKGVQIQFLGAPDEKLKEEYCLEIEKIYPEIEVRDSKENIRQVIGYTGDIVEGLKNMAIGIVLLISVLTIVLMERSFISKEKNEIALLKAIGFSMGSLSLWHGLRILFLVLIGSIIAILLTSPTMNILIRPIFSTMGAPHIVFVKKPIEIYFMYPFGMLVFSVIADGITTQYMRKISASDTTNIE